MPQFVDINGNVRKFDYTYEGQAEYEKAYQKDQESRMKAKTAPQVSQNIQNKGANLVKDVTRTWKAPGNMNKAEIAAWQDLLYQFNIIKNLQDYEERWQKIYNKRKRQINRRCINGYNGRCRFSKINGCSCKNF